MRGDPIENLVYRSFLQILCKVLLWAAYISLQRADVSGRAVLSPNWDHGHARNVPFKGRPIQLGETSHYLREKTAVRVWKRSLRGSPSTWFVV